MWPYILGGVPAVVAWWLFGDDIKKFFKGKRIVALGLPTAGKTTLLNFLGSGMIPPAEYKATAISEPIKVKKPMKLKDLELVLKDIIDVGGGDSRRRSEKIGLIKNADIILYLFRVDKWKQNPFEVEEEILSDLTAISESVNERLTENNESKVVIVGTHTDKDPEWNANVGALEYEKLIVEDPFIRGMQIMLGGVTRCNVILGSLSDGDPIEECTFQLIHALKQN